MNGFAVRRHRAKLWGAVLHTKTLLWCHQVVVAFLVVPTDL
jgi:hypothetical protein